MHEHVLLQLIVGILAIFLFENFGIFAAPLPGIVVNAIFRDFINEEQRQHFDPLRVEDLFLFKMGLMASRIWIRRSAFRSHPRSLLLPAVDGRL